VTKSVSDAKALAECDGTAEEIQTILFPKKRKARKSMEKQPDGTDRDVVSRGGGAGGGQPGDINFRLGEMFMKENSKIWLSYFYPGVGGEA
jgi:hypothetical protein